MTEAIQFTGKNLKEVRAWLKQNTKSFYRISVSVNAIEIRRKNYRSMTVFHNEYIYLDHLECLWVAAPEVFESIYVVPDKEEK